jgi:hypothetical protein
MSAKKSPAREFTTVSKFIDRYTCVGQDERDVMAVWAIGTHCFSLKCQNPATYPYLYITAPKGSGKTVLGQDVLGSICRRHQATVGITGPGVFRMIGEIDEDSGEVVNMAPTLALDEIDATFSGAKDEALRQMLNAGYKRGATVPRAFGKTTINFPVFCPKILMGIDNGHLPETVTDRSIRIDLHRASSEEMLTIEPFYSFDVEDEAAELQAELWQWAVDHSMVLRDYRPEPIPGLAPRQWEIGRSLVQLARELGVEDRIRAALARLFLKNPEKPSRKVELYGTIAALFDAADTDRLTSRQILNALDAAGVSVPGNSGKGLASVLGEDGISSVLVRLPADHPGVKDGQPVQRGYFAHQFDGPFFKYLADDED